MTAALISDSIPIGEGQALTPVVAWTQEVGQYLLSPALQPRLFSILELGNGEVSQLAQ